MDWLQNSTPIVERQMRFFRAFYISNLTARQFLAELLGTYILLVIGLGSEAMHILNPHLGSFLSVCIAWGLATSLAVWSSYGVSGGHLNPAITLTMSIIGKLTWYKVPIYWLAQYIGAFLAASTVYLIYIDAINSFDGGSRMVVGSNATAAIFAVYPQPYLSTVGGVFSQLFGTMLLVVGVFSVIDNRNAAPPFWIEPVCVGLFVTAISLTFSMNCGYAVNPARDFSPRLFTAIAGWGSTVFTEFNYFFWIPFIIPHVGAILGALVYIGLVGLHVPSMTNGIMTPTSCMDMLDG